MGPSDQRSVEVLNGVLVYTSEPLEHDLLVAGQITARLYAASDARDTDWVVRVCDVRPDGLSLNVRDGIVHARHARPASGAGVLIAGEVLAYDLTVGSTCYLFRHGHRIRVHATSSSFPAWEPNPNTGRPLGVDAPGDVVVATNMVMHSADAPSAISFPSSTAICRRPRCLARGEAAAVAVGPAAHPITITMRPTKLAKRPVGSRLTAPPSRHR